MVAREKERKPNERNGSPLCFAKKKENSTNVTKNVFQFEIQMKRLMKRMRAIRRQQKRNEKSKEKDGETKM